MKKIKGYYHINDTDVNVFNRALENAISKLQNDSQELEVQYKTNLFTNGQLVYSALIIGRVNE